MTDKITSLLLADSRPIYHEFLIYIAVKITARVFDKGEKQNEHALEIN